MVSMTATALCKDIYGVIDRVNEDCAPVAITGGRGKGAVLIGEDEWASIEEKLYLMGIHGVAESLIAGKEELADECVAEDELGW